MNRRAFLAASAAAIFVPYARAAGVEITLNGALAFVEAVLPGNGRAPFLLDTGAAATVIDPATLRRMNGELSRGLRLGIGGQYATVTPAVRDLTPVSTALNQPVAGLLGSDFLASFQVVADYAARRLVLNTGGQTRPVNGLPMRFTGMPYVQAEVRHGGAVRRGEFGVDTGLDAGVKLRDGATLQLSTANGSTVTMEGPKNVLTARVDALRIGDLDVADLSAIVSPDAAPRGAGQAYAGMIGAHAFQARILTLDFPGGWWSLSPSIL